MLPALILRTLRNADKRCLWKFGWNFGVKGMLSVEKFKRRIKRGEYFPPFLYLSITSSCNLRCQGCWVDVAAPTVAAQSHVYVNTLFHAGHPDDLHVRLWAARVARFGRILEHAVSQ